MSFVSMLTKPYFEFNIIEILFPEYWYYKNSENNASQFLLNCYLLTNDPYFFSVELWEF